MTLADLTTGQKFKVSNSTCIVTNRGTNYINYKKLGKGSTGIVITVRDKFTKHLGTNPINQEITLVY